ncbi:MAG: DEAD/DEAH box helicase [Spirochaetaceae bacterium]|jgi:SNF2 family DNA or RNA helicase|nr:DEAD/DEAH box helicase [Spirochaetaceae bacterium]
MPIAVGISEDEEFMVTSVGYTPGGLFSKMVRICRDRYHGKFQHNVSVKSPDGKFFKNPWLFDQHLAKPICMDILEAAKEEGANFTVPAWVNEIDYSEDKEFRRYRAVIDGGLVKSEWKGEYQKKGVLRGISQNRLALFWEMGLGKSFAIQCIMNHLVKWERVKKYVIVSTPEGVINIALECVKFSSFGLTLDDIFIVDTEHRNPFDFPGKKVIVMTYRGLIMLHDDFYKDAKGKRASKHIRKNYTPWDRLGEKLCLILDESHYIKNPGSKVWKIADKAKGFFDYRYILSGTPAPKYACDLWTQMRFLQEDSVARDYQSFLSGIAILGTKYSKFAVRSYREDRVKEFLSSVEYLISREKTKGNVDLPPVIFDSIRCQMPRKQELIYRTIANQVIEIIKREENGRVTLHKLRNKFPYLSSVLHDPCVLSDRELADNSGNKIIVHQIGSWDISDNGKYGIAESLLDKYAEEGRKTILWSGHPKIIDSLFVKLSKYHPYRLHGGTVVNRGESVPERNAAICGGFLNDPNSRLLIANYACLSTAVNLVEVTRMIFWDRSWNAATYKQAIKRANRIGSTEPLIVHDLIFFESIEEFQNEEIEKRLAFNDDLWDGGKGADEVLDNRDVLSLSDVQRILAGKTVN